MTMMQVRCQTVILTGAAEVAGFAAALLAARHVTCIKIMHMPSWRALWPDRLSPTPRILPSARWHRPCLHINQVERILLAHLIMRRVLSAFPNLLGVVIVTFALTRLLPGDPAAYFAGPAATPD